MVTGSVLVDIQKVNREKEGRHCHERGKGGSGFKKKFYQPIVGHRSPDERGTMTSRRRPFRGRLM